MEGGIAIALLVILVIALVVAAVFFSGVFGGAGAANKLRQSQRGSSRSAGEVPNPEQQDREKGTLFPPPGGSSAPSD
jgi:hypothetical protein